MANSKMNPKVDFFFHKARQWRPEIEKLRTILLQSPLTEQLRWGKPCYAFQGSNVVVIQSFKAYCALLFMKGFLLKDPNGILVKTGPNTRVGRQIRFTDVKDIVKMESVLKAYINAAIQIEKSGLKVELEEPKLVIPEEFQNKLDEMPPLKIAFDALTPGRQRAYTFYFSQAKQSQTRASRVEKCLPQILKGKGLND